MTSEEQALVERMKGWHGWPTVLRAAEIIERLSAERDEANKALIRFQDEVWGAFQTWSMALGWGLTGNQPECFAMMDASVDRLLTAERQRDEAHEAIQEIKRACGLLSPEAALNHIIATAEKILPGNPWRQN